jgi:hypothetical protein
MVCFRSNRLYLTLLGGLLVTSGVIAKNTAEQLEQPNSFVGSKLGPALFVLGWAIVAYSIALPGNTKRYIAPIELDQYTLMTLVATVSIVASVFMMKNLMKSDKSIPMIYPAMFVGGWLLLGYIVGGYAGMAAALLVIGSMMGVLPWQRENCVVDGPGMPMFTVAWALLAAANAM